MTWSAQYSSLDRFLHKAAFSGVGLQKTFAEIEDRVFASAYAEVENRQPVFISSLPRAGTTVLLQMMASLPQFATHTYRYMPFLLCPMTWNVLSKNFQRSMDRRERAHGDGVLIDFDSPEAFEEALWRAWWPNNYTGGRITLWQSNQNNAAFERFFNNHMKKVIAISRQATAGDSRRYITKNNANIARLPLLARLYPDCTIIVPVREPLSHVFSLHRQHMRFLEAHMDDEFSRTYMREIGHLEFGANLYPIKFPGFDRQAREATSIDFWLDYWVAAYQYMAGLGLPQINFISFDRLCLEPRKEIGNLLKILDEEACVDIERMVKMMGAPSSGAAAPQFDNSGLDAGRLDQVSRLYHQLTS